MTDTAATPAPALRPDFDPLNLRDYLAAIGLTRLVTDTSTGMTTWRTSGSRPAFEVIVEDVDAIARDCAAWVKVHGMAFDDAGWRDVKNISPQAWRTRAAVEDDLQSSFWAAIGSDGVPHEVQGKSDWTRIAASPFEYAQGGGGGASNWLGSMAAFLGNDADRYAGGKGSKGVRLEESDFERVLQGWNVTTHSKSEMEAHGASGSKAPLTVCRWDAATDREHATRHREPANDPLLQDQTVNALAAIGLATCSSAPSASGLLTPFVVKVRRGGQIDLAWPLWTTPCTIHVLETAFVLGPQSWSGWPIVRSRRRYADKIPVFSQGVLE